MYNSLREELACPAGVTAHVFLSSDLFSDVRKHSSAGQGVPGILGALEGELQLLYFS